ncbi:tRNA (guanosine(46)-N7)-methyltransferase TrmB [Dialister sp.]|uniref:tRNA (guanosine(46)-N7)-methyltransferase TrmB n=1 Tax=Dialister sp. TaxID=1955814 RepID=UPI003EFD5034
MRLRRKPWIDEAIKNYTDILYLEEPTSQKGRWREVFPHPENELHVEFGTGKGQFISGMASIHPDVNYIGMEVQEGVIYYAAKKTAEKEPPLTNVRLILGDVSEILNIFGEGEVDVIYLNFSDPWPKKRHAKRRLTYRDFLKRYALILKEGGEIRFKTDNKDLFDFSIEEFKAMGWELSDVTYDLHANPVEGDVETEYEEKFSRKGNPVCRLIARRP